ncbi:MAG TPA: CAP domain-containing protein [Candidatus Paceibacterota bacterium]|nr:CAP domain-containing protein [Candidatus Paceibacterota bacterium]
MQRFIGALRKYFVPHEGNDHRPHILRARTVAFVLLVAAAVESVFLLGTAVVVPNSRLFGIILTNALVDETNASRAANDVPPLQESPLLDAAAQEKADDMVANGYFAHTSPSGLSPWYWFEQVGYGFTYAGENLAVNFSDSQDVTDAWMNSPEHRANILDADFTQIGMAAATGTYEGHPAVYVVELFGTPAPAAPAAEAPIAVANAATVPPAAAMPKPAEPAPIIVSSTPAFVAVKGVETQAATATAAVTVSTVPAVAPIAAGSAVPQGNFVQDAAANSRQWLDDIYLAVILFFAAALGINVFVKIRIQHPQVIFGGMLVILAAGLFIVLNQHLLAGATIL